MPRPFDSLDPTVSLPPNFPGPPGPPGANGEPGQEGPGLDDNPNVYNVGKASWMFPTVQAAIAAVNARSPTPSSEDRVNIAVWPGYYDSSSFGTIDVPGFTTISAVYIGHDHTQLTNTNGPLFRCVGPFTGFTGFTLYPAAATDVYAILGNNQNNIRIENVKFFSRGGSFQGRFFKQTGSTWINVGINDVVINAGTTETGSLSSDEGVVMFENTSGSARFCDVWLQKNFWDCHTFTNVGNVLAVYGCDDVRLMHSEVRALPSGGSFGRSILITNTNARVRMNHCHLEGNLNSVFTNTGCTSEWYNTEGRGRFGATFGGAGTRIVRNSNI